MATLAVDLGGTRIKIGLVADGRVIQQTVIAAESRGGLRARLGEITEKLRSLCEAANLSVDRCDGIGMAFPCLIDPKTQRITSTIDKYPDATQIDLPEWAMQTLKLPLAVENDANAALAGEWRFGAGKGCDSCIMMTLGTGVGTSAIIDGVPLRGKHGQAGCLGGHFTLNVFGETCVCGNIGCVETEASSWSLPKIARQSNHFAASKLSSETMIDFAAVFRLAAEGDELAAQLRDRGIRVWSAAAVNLIHAYDPEIVILGGGIMKSPEPTVSMMQAHINAHAWSGWGKPTVLPAALGDSAALLGLGYLASSTRKAK